MVSRGRIDAPSAIRKPPMHATLEPPTSSKVKDEEVARAEEEVMPEEGRIHRQVHEATLEEDLPSPLVCYASGACPVLWYAMRAASNTCVCTVADGCPKLNCWFEYKASH